MAAEEAKTKMGGYGGMVSVVAEGSESAAEETLMLWCTQQPTYSQHNAFVSQSSLSLHLDACGHSLSIFQSPSSLGKPGVTGSVMWDSGVVLGKFLEHAVDSGLLLLQGKKVVELGSGCGLVGCIAALLGAQVFLTDLPDRLRLLKKNVETNLKQGDLRGSATVHELTWGDDPEPELIEPLPDYDSILEYFLEAAMKDFMVGRVDQTQWHPDYCSPRVVIYILVKKKSPTT
ncbi:uncharacterized protein LOC100259741 isoform X2 [Vitis vinifera]|uniref:uncharacterized protein LOC100259741 isoform X2 n=1 Tax=Vitis vinifera TaxID=29760 RepID=UPI0008FEB277|nr:uncharacterized protein LOC100259741 isoform X2 [Vitis vinifera]|eukprot:XP_019081628.1 PREDICTED: protein N-lysine methyltransferase METTL21A isoform X2 [Vitis vinifera]